MKHCLVIVLVVLCLSCTGKSDGGVRQDRLHAANQFKTHAAAIDNDVGKKIRNAPDAVITYLNGMDATDRYANHPLSAAERDMFMQYYGRLPSAMKQTIAQKVVAMYFIDNFAGGGMSDMVYDEQGNLYISLYFNAGILGQSLESWISLRDNSIFEPDDRSVPVEVRINGPYSGLLHTLVHEACHIYDFYHHVTPYVDEALKQQSLEKTTVFTTGVWDAYNQPIARFDYPQRTKFAFYGLGKRIPTAEAAGIYLKLGDSVFSSVYGSLSWAEDFAETFTWFYLQKQFDISYQTKVRVNGGEMLSYVPTENRLVQDRYASFASISINIY